MSERERVESGAMDPHERAFRDLLATWVRRARDREPAPGERIRGAS